MLSPGGAPGVLLCEPFKPLVCGRLQSFFLIALKNEPALGLNLTKLALISHLP